MLIGKVYCSLDVYSGLYIEDAQNYEKQQKALLQRYDFTKQGYCERFKNTKPDGQESPDMLIVKINYFNKWVELSEVGKTFEEIEELMKRE